MDPATIVTILGLIEKGVSLIPLLVESGKSVVSTVNTIKQLAQAGKAGQSISDDDLAAIEAQFDADLAEFNAPLPDDDASTT